MTFDDDAFHALLTAPPAPLPAFATLGPEAGLAAAVRRGSRCTRLVHGAAEVETRFQFGSFTKVLTAALVLQQVEAGRVALDDAVARYLPGFAVRGDITLRHLLSHSAGLADMFEAAPDADTVVQRLLALPPIAAPGVVFSYSNPGYVVLGRVLEEVSGRSWAENLQRRLLDPLGLATASLHSDAHSAPGELWPDVGEAFDAAGARLQGRAEDALRLGHAVACGAVEGGPQVLSEASRLAMATPQVRVPGAGLLARSWGLGWALIDGEASGTLVGHMGGTSALVMAHRAQEATLAVLSNFAEGARLGRAIAGELLQWSVPTAPLPDPGASPPRAGHYRSPTFSVEVQQHESGWRMSDPLRGGWLPLRPGPHGNWMVDLGMLAFDLHFGAATAALPTHLHFGLRLLPLSDASLPETAR